MTFPPARPYRTGLGAIFMAFLNNPDAVLSVSAEKKYTIKFQR